MTGPAGAFHADEASAMLESDRTREEAWSRRRRAGVALLAATALLATAAILTARGRSGTGAVATHAANTHKFTGLGVSHSDWDYSGFHLGDWGEEYPLCYGEPSDEYENNQWQSPIEIPTPDDSWKTIAEPLRFVVQDGGCEEVEMENNQHTYETSFEAAGCDNLKAVWKNRTYTLKQFHFHTESENVVAGRHFPGEMHMVHVDESGEKARFLVLGLFLETSSVAGNQFLTDLFKEGFEPIHGWDVDGSPMNPYEALLTHGDEVISFLGSFTTPPCTPNVEWIMLKETLMVDEALWANFQEFLRDKGRSDQADSYGHDYRPIQPLNGRNFSLGKISL